MMFYQPRAVMPFQRRRRCNAFESAFFSPMLRDNRYFGSPFDFEDEFDSMISHLNGLFHLTHGSTDKRFKKRHQLPHTSAEAKHSDGTEETASTSEDVKETAVAQADKLENETKVDDSTGDWELIPDMQASQDDKTRTLTMSIPNMKPEDLSVTYSNGMVRVEGSTKRNSENGYFSQSFSRAFSVPENIDEEALSCEFKDGTLTIEVPKKTEARRIPIKGSEKASEGSLIDDSQEAKEVTVNESDDDKIADEANEEEPIMEDSSKAAETVTVEESTEEEMTAETGSQ